MPIVSGTLGTYPATYGKLLTTTQQNYRRTLVDSISEAIPLWFWLNQNNRKRFQAGGESILQPLMYQLNAVQAFSGLDKLETTTKEGVTQAVFLWKHYHTAIVIPIVNLRHNVGEAQILSLMETEMEQAQISFRDALNNDTINSLGTGAAVKQLEGLSIIVQDPGADGVASGTSIYGGISGGDSGTYTWWSAQGGSGDDSEITDATLTGTNTINSMRSLYYDCVRGNDRPDVGICTQSFYEAYDSGLVDNKRYVNTMAGDAGFTNLSYNQLTLIFDRDLVAPVTTAEGPVCYFLNSKYLQLMVDPEVEFDADGFYQAHDQWAMINRIFWRGNLTCSNRARQGLILHDVP